MKSMTVSEATTLIRAKTGPAVSLYLATDVPARDGDHALRRNLHRLYHRAAAMIERSYDFKTRDRLLLPLKKALSMVGLSRSKGGIGIYHSEHFTGMVKLPTVTSDLAVASDSFHIKPLLRCVQSYRTYYLLALRKKHADLFLVTADGARQVEHIPFDHPEYRHPPADRGRDNRFMEGIKIRRQKDARGAMEQLNRQLEMRWFGERIPLLLAGPHQKQEAFRETCNYINLLATGINGSVDDLDIDSLQERSLNIMERHFEDLNNYAVVAFHKAKPSGLASTDLKEIAIAASRGQIQSLLIAGDRHIWGHLDRDTGVVQVLDQPVQTTADDLLDDLAELTLSKGGAVTVLPTIRMPGHQAIAAILRWSDTPAAMPATHRVIRDSWRKRHVAIASRVQETGTMCVI